MMDERKVREFYDRLCFALTEYENHPDNEDDPDDYHDGEALYSKVVVIVNDMGYEIN